jgi:hypothetical protein
MPALRIVRDGQSELVLRPTRAAQPEATEPEDALEMGEQHLDALAVTTGLLERLRHDQRSSHVAGVLVDILGK